MLKNLADFENRGSIWGDRAEESSCRAILMGYVSCQKFAEGVEALRRKLGN